MRESLGEVRVGLKRIELMSLTGEIYLKGEGGRQEPAIRGGGEDWTLASLPKFVSFSPGDRATLFWGKRRGVEGDWMAGFNHKTNAIGYVPQQLNQLIVPVSVGFYNFLGIVAIFAGVFGVFGLFSGAGAQGIVIIALVAGFFYWIRRRQRVVKNAVEAAVARLRQQPAGAAGPPAT
jgi:hypothetical protein